MNILIVNDDGFRGKGLHAIVRALKKEHDLTVVVPELEQSGKSHSMTFLSPLFYSSVYSSEAEYEIYTVSGTPGDCVLMALDQIMDHRPDLLISGINKGFNASMSIVYSGTVSAAYEGAVRGIPSIALSAPYFDADFDGIAEIFTKMLPAFFEKEKENPFFYNINFPDVPLDEVKGIVETTIDPGQVSEHLEKRVDPYRRTYYWHAYDCQDDDSQCDAPGSDMEALHDGYISVTPLKMDYLDYERFGSLPEFNDAFAFLKGKKR